MSNQYQVPKPNVVPDNNETRRRKALGLCVKCGVNPPLGVWLHCRECRKETDAYRTERHTAKIVWEAKAKEFGGRCIQCDREIPNPIGTLKRYPERRFVRYLCIPCYRKAWDIWRETRVSVRRQILKSIDEWRAAKGVLPETAWSNLVRKTK